MIERASLINKLVEWLQSGGIVWSYERLKILTEIENRRWVCSPFVRANTYLLYESSGVNQVDGLPPATSTGWSDICDYLW